MARFIIHHEGVYNLWCTIADSPIYSSGITKEQLLRTDIIVTDERLERAHATGSSGFGDSLDDCIAVNRSGPKEANMPRDEFIAKFLTIAKESP